MLLILCGCAAPLLPVAGLGLLVRSDGGSRAEATGGPATRSAAVDGIAPDRAMASRWEGLAAQIARSGDGRRPRRASPGLRRRHLAAVLAADARR
jgi:hypothetical protein